MVACQVAALWRVAWVAKIIRSLGRTSLDSYQCCGNGGEILEDSAYFSLAKKEFVYRAATEWSSNHQAEKLITMELCGRLKSKGLYVRSNANILQHETYLPPSPGRGNLKRVHSDLYRCEMSPHYATTP